jgi:hypothetical protein
MQYSDMYNPATDEGANLRRLRLPVLLVGRPRDAISSYGKGKNFVLSTSSRPVLGPSQPPIEWVPGDSFPQGVG